MDGEKRVALLWDIFICTSLPYAGGIYSDACKHSEKQTSCMNKRFSEFSCIYLQAQIILKPDSICNQSNKFRIGRLSFPITDCVAEHLFLWLYRSSGKSHFNRMSNGTFHTAGRSLILLCDGRIKHLRHGIEIRIVGHHKHYGSAKIFVSLYV